MPFVRTQFFRRAFIGALFFLSFMPTAFAHPHAWIDVQVRVLFTDQGEVKGLRQIWRMDESYTVFVLQGLVEHEGETYTPPELQAVADKIMGNLKPYNFLTTTSTGMDEDNAPSLETATAEIKDGRLALDFTMNFTHAIKADAFTYKVFDPNYYVEMLHVEDGSGIKLLGAPKGCAFNVIRPNPPIEAVIKAASMDPMAAPDAQLGKLFAEEVKLACP